MILCPIFVLPPHDPILDEILESATVPSDRLPEGVAERGHNWLSIAFEWIGGSAEVGKRDMHLRVHVEEISSARNAGRAVTIHLDMTIPDV